jgi:hypothetical protein
VSAALLALLLQASPDAGALETLAADVAAQARAAGAEAPLAVSVVAPGHDALQEAFTTVLLPRLQALGLEPQVLSSGTDAEAVARSKGTRTLLRVRLTLDGTLTLTGDVLSTWVNFFSGRTARKPRPAAVVYAEVAQDAAVRALARGTEAPGLLLSPLPLARWPVRTAALASGDLDGDGKPELAVLTEDAVEVRALDGRLLARRGLEGLPEAEAPPREAFGTLCICDGLLYAFSARRAQGEVLALVASALVPHATLVRPVVACGHPPLEASFLPFAARLVPVGPGWPALPPGPAAWGLSSRGGAGAPLFLLLLEDGTARAGPGPLRTLQGVGAGAALLEAPPGGALRVAASTAAQAPATDRLRLLFLADAAEGNGVEVPGRILQVTAARLETDGTEALVLGVWRPEGGAELRVVRGAH